MTLARKLDRERCLECSRSKQFFSWPLIVPMMLRLRSIALSNVSTTGFFMLFFQRCNQLDALGGEPPGQVLGEVAAVTEQLGQNPLASLGGPACGRRCCPA